MADMTKEQVTVTINGIKMDEKTYEYIFKLGYKLGCKEHKQGEWCKQNDDYYDWYECSECGYGSEGEMQYSREYDVRTNFCPCCGADMRGNENG